MTRSQATPASSQIITMTRMLEERDTEIEALTEVARWAYGKLHARTFSDLDDALMLDRIKLLLEHAPVG